LSVQKGCGLGSEFVAGLIGLLPRLRRFGAALTGSLDAADDLVQAACERALRAEDTWQPGTRLDSWLFRIMQNLWIDQRRQAARRGSTVPIDELITLAGMDGRQLVEANLTLAAVWSAIDRLPEEQRAVLVAVCVEGLPYQEAAQLLGVPIGTVTSRLHRARLALAEQLGFGALPVGADPRSAGPAP
jgi:RNA polymerase sigma-70 factor (ECF subfamily)